MAAPRDELRIAREGVQGGRRIAPEARGRIVCWHVQMGAVEARQRGVGGAPEPCYRGQRWNLGRQAHEADVGQAEAQRGRMGPAMVREQAMPAVREAQAWPERGQRSACSEGRARKHRASVVGAPAPAAEHHPKLGCSAPTRAPEAGGRRRPVRPPKRLASSLHPRTGRAVVAGIAQ